MRWWFLFFRFLGVIALLWRLKVSSTKFLLSDWFLRWILMSGQRFIAGIRRHYVALILRAGQRPVLMALRLRECWRNIGNHRENSGISSPSSKNPHQIRKDHISAIQFVIKKKKKKKAMTSRQLYNCICRRSLTNDIIQFKRYIQSKNPL